jgi:hypothetical protein
MASMLIFAASAALLIHSAELIYSAEQLTVCRRERRV